MKLSSLRSADSDRSTKCQAYEWCCSSRKWAAQPSGLVFAPAAAVVESGQSYRRCSRACRVTVAEIAQRCWKLQARKLARLKKLAFDYVRKIATTWRAVDQPRMPLDSQPICRLVVMFLLPVSNRLS